MPLIVAVLVLTYFLLMRAFRSVLLPLKAVLLNLLSVGRELRDARRRSSAGASATTCFGLYQFGQVEGWIPIFLFAMLFGLSMDYEVFLVTRMREAWDEGADNATAVAHGLERTGPDHHRGGDHHVRRVLRASSPAASSACRSSGSGSRSRSSSTRRSSAALLVPSMMAILGRWNWWLPPALARLVRVAALAARAHLARRRPVAG